MSSIEFARANGPGNQDRNGRETSRLVLKSNKKQEIDIMLTKIAFGLAIILATASGSLAAIKTHAVAPNHNVYNPFGAYVGSDPDANVRFELNRDGAQGR
jgi:hypothetical protein